MTALEMKYEFDIKLRDILKALNHPFTTHEVSRLMNKSQLALVREYAKYFEQNEEFRKVLSPLVTPYTVTLFVTDAENHTNGAYVRMPEDLIKVVAELVNGSIAVKPVSLDEYSSNITNPFKKPSSALVWRLDRNDKHELITDGTVTLTSYSMDYIDYPPDIDVDNSIDCVLAGAVHDDIVEGAIKSALIILSRKAQMFNTKSDK